MKKLFTAIRASDLEAVRQIIDKKPALVNCVAKQPPKKDDGQSPLQVALKTGNTAIAGFLLDMGADVNALDSYGNSGLNRFALQAKQVLPPFNYVEHREETGRIFTEELHEDLRRVLQALKDAGADASYKAPNLGYTVREFCSEGSISILFDEVFGRDMEIDV